MLVQMSGCNCTKQKKASQRNRPFRVMMATSRPSMARITRNGRFLWLAFIPGDDGNQQAKHGQDLSGVAQAKGREVAHLREAIPPPVQDVARTVFGGIVM